MQEDGSGTRMNSNPCKNNFAGALNLRKMKTYYYFLVLYLFLCSGNIYAQHEHHQIQSDTIKKADSKMDKMDSEKMMDSIDSSAMPPMSHSFSLNLPMNRNGSGTG